MRKISATTQLKTKAFVSFSGVDVTVVTSPNVTIVAAISPEMVYESSKPFTTPITPRLTALTVAAIPSGTQFGKWKLKSVLLFKLRQTRRKAVASTWLEGAAEYGSGRSEEEAIIDLVNSLGEYREVLEKRYSELGKGAREDLIQVKKLIERSHAIPKTAPRLKKKGLGGRR